MSDKTTTYRHANGELVYGEYATVGDLDYFDDEDPGVQIIEEVWVLERRRIGTVHDQLCHTCMGEGETDEGLMCSACKGSGEYTGDRITWEDQT